VAFEMIRLHTEFIEPSQAMTNTIFVHFWGRSSRSSKSLINIQLRITVNSERVEIGGINIQLNKAEWNQSQQKVKGVNPLSNQLNLRISSIKSDILSIYNHYEVNKELVSADKIKSIYKGETRKRVTFQDLFTEYVLVHKPSSLTVSGYERRYKKLFLYTDVAYPDEVTRVTLNKLDAAMTKNGYGKAYIYKCKAAIKMLIEFGASLDMLQSKITNVKLTLERKYNLECLTDAETNQLIDFKFGSQIFQKVIDLYLFSCRTGLTYIDLHNYEIIETPFMRYIKGQRTKTKTEYFTPLFRVSEAILKKYGGVLPRISNQRCNSVLKEALPLAGVMKQMKFHSGRKTFANHCINTLLYSKDATAKMMGQKDTKELTAYAEVDQNRVISETIKLIA
jgi:hypothetical protein